MSKIHSVIRHEYLTIVKQPSFWIVMIAIPALIGVIIALTYFGNKSSEDRIEEIEYKHQLHSKNNDSYNRDHFIELAKLVKRLPDLLVEITARHTRHTLVVHRPENKI